MEDLYKQVGLLRQGDGWYRHIALGLICIAAWALKEYELGQHAEKWLASPQSLLDGDLIEDGRLDEVMRLVAQLRDCEDLDDFPGRS